MGGDNYHAHYAGRTITGLADPTRRAISERARDWTTALKIKHVSRYHPLLVMLHWLLAVLIIAALAIGFFWLAGMPEYRSPED